MEIIGQKWKLPILWYIADAENQTLRYRELPWLAGHPYAYRTMDFAGTA